MQDLETREPKHWPYRVERAKYSVKRVSLRDAFMITSHRPATCYEISRLPRSETTVQRDQSPFWSSENFFSTKTIDQLIIEQRVAPVADISIFAGVIPDEDIDEFVADIYRDRLL